jgi:glycolate oxidase FAD binding subunit
MSDTIDLAPGTEAELAEAVADAASRSTPLEIAGGGSRAGLGRPVQAARRLSTRGLSGIELYEPGALTLVSGAGTPLSEIEAALAAEGQMLPFEPMDHRALLGTAGEPTIGGMVATAASGPRRISAGACRDAMLGVRFVNGRGEAVANGGRVMKNVTGYDLVKLMAGAHGTLGVLTQVAFKVLPAPKAVATLTLHGLDEARAVEAMSAALGSPFQLTGAAHHPEGPGGGAATILRLEGLEGSVAYRADALRTELARFGEADIERDPELHAALWRRTRDVEPLAGLPGAVWRLSVRPSDAPGILARLRARRDILGLVMDWGGGLVHLATPEEGDAGAADIRAETARAGGHATLIRASAATRAAVAVFEPEAPGLARIAAGLRAKFDPHGILNPGRMSA